MQFKVIANNQISNSKWERIIAELSLVEWESIEADSVFVLEVLGSLFSLVCSSSFFFSFFVLFCSYKNWQNKQKMKNKANTDNNNTDNLYKNSKA